MQIKKTPGSRETAYIHFSSSIYPPHPPALAGSGFFGGGNFYGPHIIFRSTNFTRSRSSTIILSSGIQFDIRGNNLET